ncbi:class I SAM-dependent methyltransferase [Xanthomonas sp. MUS 060]|uniref:class I SAM-dependent methyltransferase n=1 Tax=Xanthomonas sp. MUS 060 TaxID=1588031 RepID=UPI0005F2B08F|nr:class I SAM-dependent methyltransferase [Xanthomonas sp. MUS 060]
MSIDAAAPQHRFSNRVEDYVRYRPDYPPALMAWVHGALGVAPTALVADIGAGTGISSRMFLRAGHPTLAVEPNAAMRRAAETMLHDTPGFRVIDGSAEATTLADASIDLISAAQAFHWFDPVAVRREWARVLRPGGLTLVYWNTRLLDATPFLQGYEQLLLDYGTDYSAVSERHPDDATMHRWFGAGLRDSAQFPNLQRLDFDFLRGRLLSSSYAPLPGHPRHAPMLEALRALFDQHQADGTVDIHYHTRAFAGTLN